MENVLVHFAKTCTDRSKFRRSNSVRYLVLCFFQLLAYQLSCKINIDIVLKYDGYNR